MRQSAGRSIIPTSVFARTAGAWAVCTLVVSAPLTGQCVGNLAEELTALTVIAGNVSSKTFEGGAAWDKFMTALRDDAAFFKALADAGVTGPCLLPTKDAYRNTVEAALLRAVPNKELKGKEAEVKAALQQGAAAALGMRYSPNDRMGVVFGFGMSVIQHEGDAQMFKVISRRGTGTDTATRQYIVEESHSQALPIATTGLAIRFRDRRSTCGSAGAGEKLANSCTFWVLDHVWPTSVFGAMQFGGGEGAVSGVTLGVGWRLVADVNLLVGYGITRLASLRPDIRQAFRANTSGVLPLPTGESEESIKGTQSQQAFTITLGIPLALRNALGGR